MPPAIIAAGVGAAASIGGAALSSKSSKKAANTAAQAQTDNTAANNALARELYGQNSTNMQPFMQSGLRANRLLDGFLYGGPSTEYVGAQNDNAMVGGYSAVQGGGYSAQPGQFAYNSPGGNEPRNLNVLGDMDRISPLYGIDGGMDGAQFGNGSAYGMSPTETPYGGGVTAGGTAQPGQTPQNAWDTFRNSTNYQFRLGQGMDGVQQGYAGAGALQSGAAMKGIAEYNQNFASNELNNYLGLLQGQQGLGMQGASALAGVSNNYGNQVTANNNNAADNLSVAAALRGNANSQMYGQIGSSLGSLASSFKW